MPALIKFSDWQAAVNKRVPSNRSAQLNAVTNAFSTYNTSPNLTNLNLLATAFQTWRTTNTVKLTIERSSLADEVLDLEYTITKAQNTNVVINARATNVGAVGWNLVVWDENNPGAAHPELSTMTAVSTAQELPALTPSELQRVNEALRRAIKAVELARDAMITISQKTALGSSRTLAEQSYVDYFGTYNQAQARTVTDNFKALCLAFTGTPTFVDMRNTTFGLDGYAACPRVNLVTKSGGRLTLSGSVLMLLLRDFFNKGGYSSSTDNTVGTLVHEFAHGTFKAVDAPKVDTFGSWELTPAHETDPTHIDHGETPDNDKQSSTRELDKRLALKSPTIAQRNADNYGQFAAEALLRSYS
jgi:hypothetical protein